MKIIMPKQFQDFLRSIGLSIENILEQAGIPNILWKEEIQLSTEEYYLFLKKLMKSLLMSKFQQLVILII